MRYVIVANGDFVTKDLLLAISQDKYIIALDNAAERLLALKIIPHYLIGDNDSLSPYVLQQLNADPMCQVIINSDQNTTDLQKAIAYCDDNGATSIDIVCALGDRIDHTLFNIRLLRQYYRFDRKLLLHSQQQTLLFIKDNHIEFSGKIGDPCGLFAFPKATFSSTGLAYDGKLYPLEFALTDSLANYLTKSHVYVSIQGEALLIMPGFYRQTAQGE